MRVPKKWLLGAAVAAAVGLAPAAEAGGPLDIIFRGQSAEATPSNNQTAQAVAAALRSGKLTGKDIQIEVQNGQAVLKGQIKDAGQKAKATALVAAVPGVLAVKNEMTTMAVAAPQTALPPMPEAAPQQPIVQTAAATPAPAPAPKQTNQQVAQQIATQLSHAGLSKYDLEIRYSGGKATLKGDVGSPAEAVQAQRLCESVPAVQTVANELTVGGRTAQDFLAARQQQIQQVQHLSAPPMPAGPQGMPPQGMPPQMAMGGQPMGVPGMGVQPAGHHAAGQAMGVPMQGSPVYNNPNLPNYAWPTTAPYDNYAAVTYPSQYDASAFPYIGPFYPYPQVPMGWRSAQLDWDDGYWKLRFESKTDKWWWFVNPANWH